MPVFRKPITNADDAAQNERSAFPSLCERAGRPRPLSDCDHRPACPTLKLANVRNPRRSEPILASSFRIPCRT